ncbi:MAG: hypothetical protein U9R19_15130 [Bacteroidota bacterium]|nr:hypothetical protein [Bacteroidota bacterium]
MLPKFLFADNSQEAPGIIYVVHTEQPRCIFKCENDEDFSENHEIHWIDAKPDDNSVIDNLIIMAEDFLDAEMESQEDLYDEDFDE